MGGFPRDEDLAKLFEDNDQDIDRVIQALGIPDASEEENCDNSDDEETDSTPKPPAQLRVLDDQIEDDVSTLCDTVPIRIPTEGFSLPKDIPKRKFRRRPSRTPTPSPSVNTTPQSDSSLQSTTDHSLSKNSQNPSVSAAILRDNTPSTSASALNGFVTPIITAKKKSN